MNSFDLIGDIHGQARELEALLAKLGYSPDNGVYSHPSRKVIFLGDLIDGGEQQREVIAIVRTMVEAGNALCILGNHELNAIAWKTPTAEGEGFLRPHDEDRKRQHQAFLNAYENSPQEWEELIAWFRTLPLFLDLQTGSGGLRAIHACWDKEIIKRVKPYLHADNSMQHDFLVRALTPKTQEFEDVEVLLKGKEIQLPDGQSFSDHKGKKRHHIRIKWWESGPKTLRELFLGPPQVEEHIPDQEAHGDYLVEYGRHEPPLFLGHYWLTGKPSPLAKNIACLDYSVARESGKLVAYQWDGEQSINDEKFVCVERKQS